jgi:anaerobic sulfite reductase subunit C
MHWDNEANEFLNRVPVFVRPLARRKVEGFAREHGADRVTVGLARAAYDAFRGGAGASADAGSPDRSQLPPAPLIERLEREAQTYAAGERLNTRYYHVRPCAGAVGCPRSLIPVRETAELVAQRIADTGFPAFLDRGMAGRPILSHHRFQAAVAGCPNACSQPQICDFGVIGVTSCAISPEKCDRCSACVEACREGAIALDDSGPLIDAARCLKCGDCARACPTDALALGAPAFALTAGGRLGRHPRLASPLTEAQNATEVAAVLNRVVRMLMVEAKPGERVAAVMARRSTGLLNAPDEPDPAARPPLTT